MSKFIRWFFMLFWFEHFLGQRFQWYRRWYGGRWELHWIDICASDIWLSMSNDPARQWPAYRQPCSFGTPLIEDWPIRGLGRMQRSQAKPDQKGDPFVEIVATVGMYLCGVAMIGIIVGIGWSLWNWFSKVFS